jgi:alanine racemase
MKKSLRYGLRTWLEIDKKAIAHNLDTFRKLIPKQTKLLAVVKSNAYGHGLIDFSKQVSVNGVDWLGVDSIMEALSLRREGIKKPILVLGYTLPEMIPLAVTKNISLTLSDTSQFLALKNNTTKKKIKFHLKVDTGMHRQGFSISEIDKVLGFLKKHSSQIILEGVYTHFSSAKDPACPEETDRQLAEFNQWSQALFDAHFAPLRHASATAGTLLFPEAHFDLVRIGIGIYGHWPAIETKKFLGKKITLKPVLSWRTIVSEIKNVHAGEGIGYDLTEKVTRLTKVAICPIGYWHGFSRSLSNVGYVLVGGKRCKVLGRVCMDIIMIDVTDVTKTKIGDEVTIIGRDGKEEITAEELAGLSGTSVYEFLTRINPLIKKVIV